MLPITADHSIVPQESAAECCVIVPVFNEESGVEATLYHLIKSLKGHLAYQLVVVNDGSSDATAEVLQKMVEDGADFKVVTHDVNQGYGAALKTGIRNSTAEFIVITDGDGSYPNQMIPKLVALCHNQDMVVGARIGDDVEYSRIRYIPKIFLQAWVSWLARRHVPDINSGLRVFRRSIAENYLGILPNAFSFTITITLAMMTNYRRVIFTPIGYSPRIGKSKIKPIRDTLKFVGIILRTGTYFAPLRIFMPACALGFLAFFASLVYDVFVLDDLTDKTVILLLLSLNIGMFGLIADMIDKRSKT
jgi:glycosyltransferase involved in cell wall biosynthesis